MVASFDESDVDPYKEPRKKKAKSETMFVTDTEGGKELKEGHQQHTKL